MTPQERNAARAWQRRFIRELSASTLADMQLALDRDLVPIEWTGHQLRYWLAVAMEEASELPTSQVKREVHKVMGQIDDERRNK